MLNFFCDTFLGYVMLLLLFLLLIYTFGDDFFYCLGIIIDLINLLNELGLWPVLKEILLKIIDFILNL
jgi:hypothetical protein